MNGQSTNVASDVGFITFAASALIAQKWGVRPGEVLRVLSTPDALAVTTTRYLLALTEGMTFAEAAGSVGLSLLTDAETRAAF